MTILTASALAALIAANPTCTVPGMVPDFWLAVVKVESHYDPNAIRDDTANMSFYPTNTDSAVELTTLLMRQGHSVGVGLSQLTATSEQQFQAKFGLTVRQALDPCVNMRAGALFYVSGALSTYNGGSPTASPGYARSVQAAVEAQQPAPNAPVSPPPSKPQPLHSHMRDLLHPDQSNDDHSSPNLIQIPEQPKDQQDRHK